jgi:hypothetical protein
MMAGRGIPRFAMGCGPGPIALAAADAADGPTGTVGVTFVL